MNVETVVNDAKTLAASTQEALEAPVKAVAEHKDEINTINGAVAKLLQDAGHAVSEGVTLLGAEISDIAMQFILYRGVVAGVALLTSLLVLIGGVTFLWKVRKIYKKKWFEDNDGNNLSKAGSAIFIYGSGLLIVGECLANLAHYGHELILISIAPKWFLIQEAAKLVN